DGARAGLPSAALPGGRKGTYLLEEYAIGYLTSGRHLLELRAEGAAEARAGLLAVGGVDYGEAPAAKPEVRLGPRSAVWKPLPGTRPEAEVVAAAYARAFPKGAKPVVLTGKAADAGRLKRELSPGAGAGRYG